MSEELAEYIANIKCSKCHGLADDHIEGMTHFLVGGGVCKMERADIYRETLEFMVDQRNAVVVVGDREIKILNEKCKELTADRDCYRAALEYARIVIGASRPDQAFMVINAALAKVTK